MASDKAPLRVLYTINSSPQYILARSHSPFPIASVATQSTSEAPLYATVSLRKCLDTICRSSPELLQDTSRDFSVYVLDPLESNSAPAPVNISNSNQGASSSSSSMNSSDKPRGVAVGLGLMSWVLQADENDSPAVTGTLIKQGTSQISLEVIFALRETVAMTNPSMSTGYRSWYTPQITAGMKKSTSLTFLSNASVGPSGSQTSSQPSSSSFKPPDASIPGSSTAPPSHSTNSTSTVPSSAPQELRSFSASTASAETLATIASIYSRNRAKEIKPKPRKTARISSVPPTGSDMLLVPETYIGPQKKKGRRPKGSNIEEERAPTTPVDEVIVIDDASDDNCPVKMQDPPSDASGVLSEVKSTPNTKRRRKRRSIPDTSVPPFSVGPLIRDARKPSSASAIPTPNPSTERESEPTLRDLISLLSASSSSFEATQNAAVLAALSSIDSPANSSNTEANPNLANAIRQLLLICSQPSAGPSSIPSANPPLPYQPDDDIVLLDKENVNPGAFKRRSENVYQDAKLEGFISPPASLQPPFSEAEQSRGLSMRSNENSPPKTSVASNSTTELRRKRTLSEFMDERESQARSKGKARERGRVERKDTYHDSSHHHRHASSSGNVMRHYSRLLSYNQPRPANSSSSSYYNTGFDPWTFPPRANRPEQREIENDGKDDEDSTTPQSIRVARVSVSSPVRQNSASHIRKKYIVPEWARTTTALQPRLSEEAQRALEEAQEKKKKDKTTRKGQERMRHRTRSRPSKPIPACDEPSSSQTSTTSASTSASISTTAPSSDFVRPIAPSSDCPVFSFPGLPPFSASSSCQSSRSSSPSPCPAVVPKTPTREKRSFRATPGGEHESLFTPLTGSHGPLSAGNGCSPLFSPYIGGVPVIPESPLGKKSKMSPIQSVVQGKGIPLNSGWGSPLIFEERNLNRPNVEEEEDDLETALSKEPDDTSRIPGNSRAEHKPETSQSHRETEDEEDFAERRRQLTEQWETLPPSSPPPPTSPGPMFQDDEDNDLETDTCEMDCLNPPTSASDAEFDPCLFDTDTSTPMDDMSAYSEDEMTLMTCLDEQLNSFLSEMEDEGLDTKSTPSEADIFEQFTNLNAQSSDGIQPPNVPLDPGFGTILQNGLQNMDFSEFWETFKPLIQQEGNEASTDSTIGLAPSEAGEIQIDPPITQSLQKMYMHYLVDV